MLHETVIGGNSNCKPIFSLFRGPTTWFGWRNWPFWQRGGKLPGVSGRLGKLDPKRQERQDDDCGTGPRRKGCSRMIRGGLWFPSSSLGTRWGSSRRSVSRGS